MLFFGFDSISVRYCTGEMTRKVLVLALLTVALAYGAISGSKIVNMY